jgi:uncharacterized membrane protein YfcA
LQGFFSTDLSIYIIITIGISSFFIGILGGFVGLALGTIRLPIIILLGIDPRIAAGTNIITSTISSFFGTVRHIQEKNVNKQIILFMGIPAVIGALLGGYLAPHIPVDLLLFSAGLLVFWQGVEFIILARSQSNQMKSAFGIDLENSTGIFSRNRVITESSVGLSIGLIGGAVGLILGSIRLPAIIRILKIDPRIAAGSNLFIGFFMGIAGLVGHAFHGHVDYFLVLIMGSGAAIGSYIGANFTKKVSINTFLLILGIVLSCVGLILASRPLIS